jgi:formamidopyrimidine-DNA glycosylase
MPELPEVETIKNELAPHITGQMIIGVVVQDDKLLQGKSVGEFCGTLLGRRVVGLNRRGKYLMFHISGGKILVMHLRMTGSLLLNSDGSALYTRAVLQFGNGEQLAFIDRRRLGVMWLANNEIEVTGKLGIEPLTKEFTIKMLANKLKGREAPIKAVLLDQSIVAGIGNMYADEALFAAKIHPMKRAGDLSPLSIRKLHKAIVTILESAIMSKGASVDTYKRPGGEDGTAHSEFHVAHRYGDSCGCGGKVDRIFIRNRGSYFCPRCQKL